MLNVVMALYREARTMQCYRRSYLATNKGDYVETYLGGVTMAKEKPRTGRGNSYSLL